MLGEENNTANVAVVEKPQETDPAVNAVVTEPTATPPEPTAQVAASPPQPAKPAAPPQFPDEYYKGIQRTLDKTTQRNKALEDTLLQMQEELAILKDERGREKAEAEGKTYQESHIAALRTKRIQEQQKNQQLEALEQEQMLLTNDLNRRMVRLKIHPDDARLKGAADLWSNGKFREAHSLAIEVLDDIKEEQLVAKITGVRKQVQKAEGLYGSEGNSPTGGGATNDDKFVQEYSAGNRDTPEDHLRMSKILQKIQKGG